MNNSEKSNWLSTMSQASRKADESLDVGFGMIGFVMFVIVLATPLWAVIIQFIDWLLCKISSSPTG